MVFGNYGGGNIGDEALLESTLSLLKKQGIALHNISVLSKNPDGIKFNKLKYFKYSFRHPSSLIKLLFVLNKTDLLLIGGGGIIDFSHDASIPIYCLTPVLLAKMLRKKVAFLGVSCSISPKSNLSSKILKQFIALVLNRVDALLVRDIDSKTNLEKINVRDVKVCVDLVFNFAPTAKQTKDRIVAFNLRPWFFDKLGSKITQTGSEKATSRRFAQTIADLADYLISQYGIKIIFVPFSFGESEENDLKICEITRSLMRNKQNTEIFSDPMTFSNYWDLLRRVQLSVGMRYHFLAFSALAGTPIIGIAYNAKIYALSKALRSNAIPASNMDPNCLKKLIDETIQNLDVLQSDLEKRVKSLHVQSSQYEEELLSLVEY